MDQPRRPTRRAAVITVLGLLLVASCSIDDTPAASPQSPPATAEQTEPGTPPTTDTALPTELPDELVPGPAWERAADAPAALTEVAAAAHDGRLWVGGGLTADGSVTTAVLIFDPAEDRWTEGPPLPSGTHHAVLVSNGDSLYLLGGYRGSGFGQPTDEVWVLDEHEDAWGPAVPLPEPRAAGAAAWDGDRILFAGGVGPGGVAADIYALTDDRWEQVGQLGNPREHLAAASDGHGRTWFLAGRQGSLETNTGRIEVVDGSDVEQLHSELAPRSGVGAFWIPSIGACLVGGETPSGTLPIVECVSDDDEIVDLAPLAVARHGLGAARLGDGVYAVLGGEQPGLYVSAAVERLPMD